jgi:branched-chain amino acid transport system ATP-binding protein
VSTRRPEVPPAAAGPGSALELDAIHTYRGAAHVLQGVSLRVAAGEAVCLVGRNGAGKTTTIESAMGLLSVRAGRISLQGRDITRLPTYERARLGIGYAPEDAGIFPDLTVAENFQISQTLASGRRAGGAGAGRDVDERVLALFPEVRQFLDRRGLNLSGGQKKMVAIARAVTLSPSVLLLDEPFEGLAPVVVGRFIEATRRIKDMGVSLLIAESNLATASRIADRLYAIDRGEIIFQGDPRAALSNEEVMRTLRG